MNAETLLRNDLPEIFKFNAAAVIKIAKAKVAAGTMESLIASPEWEKLTAIQEVIFLTAFNALADEAGRTRGGTPSLGDEILDRQVGKVKEFGAKAYRLSAKQVVVILRDAFVWIR